MNEVKEIEAGVKELAGLCRKTGSDIYQVQAAGGNISIKLNSSELVIKASGARMKEVDAQNGWTVMRYDHLPRTLEALAAGIFSGNDKEIEYANILGGCGKTAGRRPSMEAGFHSVIPGKYVAHLHSVSGIALGMTGEKTAREMLRECFPAGLDTYFIPASIPGFEVTRKIQELKLSASSRPRLIIIKNHGLVWEAPTLEALEGAISDFENFFANKFGTRRFGYFHELGSKGCLSRERSVPADDGTSKAVCMCHWPQCRIYFKPSFPDFIMYYNFWTGTGAWDLIKIGERALLIKCPSSGALLDKEEVLFAHEAVCSIGGEKGPDDFMPQAMVGAIKNLETERLRFAQMKQAKENKCK